jgi:putative FmdB family regulatory protein
MPNYDYICDKCEYTAEIFQSMKDAPLVECPKCHAPAFRRLIGTGAGIIFKGSGFYQTDYKNSKSSVASETAGSSAKATPCGGGCACHPPKKASQSASNLQTAS